jgi:hypothetical protein
MRRFLFLVTIVAVVTIAAAGAASGGVSGARAVPVLPGSRTAAGPTLPRAAGPAGHLPGRLGG